VAVFLHMVCTTNLLSWGLLWVPEIWTVGTGVTVVWFLLTPGFSLWFPS